MSVIRVYLSLGSNIGDRLANLAQAIRAISEAGHRVSGADARALMVTAVSPVYETTPLGPGGAILTDQRAYFNCAAEVDCALPADALLWMTTGIEAAMGRVHGERWAPRVVDIDLLLFGIARIDTPELQIPHPHMLERAFVLRPRLLGNIAASRWPAPMVNR